MRFLKYAALSLGLIIAPFLAFAQVPYGQTLTVSLGTINLASATSFSNTTTFVSSSVFSSPVSFTNYPTFSSTVTMPDSVTLFNSTGPVLGGTASAVTVAGTSTFTSPATFSSAVTLSKTLSDAATTTFTSGVTFSSAVAHANTETFTSGVNFSSGITNYAPQYSVYTASNQTGNPMVQVVYASFTSAQALAGTNVLNSATGRTIFPGTPTIMVSGTAGGATNVVLECQPSATVIATFPIATLVDGKPVNPFSSNAITTAKPLIAGCSAADSIMVSSTGTLTTTSQIFVNMPYIIQ